MAFELLLIAHGGTVQDRSLGNRRIRRQGILALLQVYRIPAIPCNFARHEASMGVLE